MTSFLNDKLKKKVFSVYCFHLIKLYSVRFVLCVCLSLFLIVKHQFFNNKLFRIKIILLPHSSHACFLVHFYFARYKSLSCSIFFFRFHIIFFLLIYSFLSLPPTAKSFLWFFNKSSNKMDNHDKLSRISLSLIVACKIDPFYSSHSLDLLAYSTTIKLFAYILLKIITFQYDCK